MFLMVQGDVVDRADLLTGAVKHVAFADVLRGILDGEIAVAQKWIFPRRVTSVVREAVV